ncbi:MAG: response regulator [Deltaproteobacteria bacterium]|nr:response regulator [Deltaproteobacteria bacterium]
MSKRVSPPTTAPSVLIVDDDLDLTDLLSQLLVRKGMRPVTAANGKQCLEFVQHHPAIDVIVLDITMPEMDGLQACAVLKQREKTREIPIILLTAKDDASVRHASATLGVAEFLMKPVSGQDLIASIRAQLERRSHKPEGKSAL